MDRRIRDLRAAFEGGGSYPSVEGAGIGCADGSIAARAGATCQSLEVWKTLWPRRRKPVKDGSAAPDAPLTPALV